MSRRSYLPILLMAAAVMAAALPVCVSARMPHQEFDRELLEGARLIQAIEYEILRSQTRLAELRVKLAEIEQHRTSYTKSQKAAASILIRLMRRPEHMALVAGLDLARGERIIADVQNKASLWLQQLTERNRAIAALAADVEQRQRALKHELNQRKAMHQKLEHLLAQKARHRNADTKRASNRSNQYIAQRTKNASTLISDIIRAGAQQKYRSSRQGEHLLLRPGAGKMLTGFGEKNILGMHALGLSLAMLPQARIIAPMSGQVLFAGQFRNHGQTVIIASPGNYHLLLSGLQRLDVRSGDAVFAGEPIGLMPQGGAPQEGVSQGENAPILYLEARHHGRPIDPEMLFAKN